MLGYFTYKYQLLYAMDQPRHATGGAWRLICYRILLGLGVLHLTMAGYLGALKAYAQAVFVIPALFFTVWYSFYFGKRFDPLTRFISLRSIRREIDLDEHPQDEREVSDTQERQPLRRKGSTVDEDREKGLRFVNPSLVVPLEPPWIYQDPPPRVHEDEEDDEDGDHHDHAGVGEASGRGYQSQGDAHDNTESGQSNSSTVSLGDTHVWRE